MIRNYPVEIIKEFFIFFTPTLAWGLYFHEGTALAIFLFSVSSAIFGYSAATRWIESAQEGSLSNLEFQTKNSPGVERHKPDSTRVQHVVLQYQPCWLRLGNWFQLPSSTWIS